MSKVETKFVTNERTTLKIKRLAIMPVTQVTPRGRWMRNITVITVNVIVVLRVIEKMLTKFTNSYDQEH